MKLAESKCPTQQSDFPAGGRKRNPNQPMRARYEDAARMLNQKFTWAFVINMATA